MELITTNELMKIYMEGLLCFTVNDGEVRAEIDERDE